MLKKMVEIYYMAFLQNIKVFWKILCEQMVFFESKYIAWK